MANTGAFLPDFFLGEAFLDEALLLELLFDEAAGLLTLLGAISADCVFTDLEEVFLTPGRTGVLLLLPFPVFFIISYPQSTQIFLYKNINNSR
jgi:hypothetical protein